MIGTPYSMSPEICSNQPYTNKTDIWSLGIVLYEMCALRKPFNAKSLPFLAMKISRGSFRPVPNHFTVKMKKLIRKLLTVNPGRRPTVN